MCKLVSGQLLQREMANKYLLVVSKNHSHKTLSFDCRSVCVFTETNVKGDSFIPDWGNMYNSEIYWLQLIRKKKKNKQNVFYFALLLQYTRKMPRRNLNTILFEQSYC